VQTVLKDCLRRLKDFKDNLTTFQRFFAQLHNLVEVMNDTIVDEVLLSGQGLLGARDAEVMAANLKVKS